MKIAQVLHPVKNITRLMAALGLLISLFGFASVHAEVIDQIDIKQTGDQAEIQLHFITPIQYKRHLILKNGDIRIYVTLLDIQSDDSRLVWEKKDSPPSDIVPPFTVTYPELDSSLTLSFGKVIKCRVRPGSDGRSLSILTKVIKAKKQGKAKLPAATLTEVPVLPIAAAVVDTAAAVSAEAATSASVTTGAVSTVLPEPAIPAEPAAEGAGFPTDLPAETQKTPEQIQQEAQQLFAVASEALQNNQIDASVEALNKVLSLPPNTLTQPAQELMGEAREKNGEYVKARAEYELYLRLYPNAADLKQVQARIANLPATEVKVTAAASEAVQKTNEEKLKITGGISQNFYKGFSNTETFSINGNQPPIKITDLSQLVTSLDMMMQKRTETKDTRLVLREYNRINFLPNQPEDYRWNAAYLEQSARDRKYMYRLGRQSGSSGGTPGRFDGVAAGYSINQTWRLNAAVGRPVEYVRGGNPADPKTFYSGSIDLTRLPDQWSGSVYGVLQFVDGYRGKVGGIKERRALGVEAHYFEQQRSYMTQMEYDTIYQKVNLATFQGNWSQESGANYYMTIDHRRSPPLALNLQGQYTQSLKQLLNENVVVSLQDLRNNSIALSPISNMLSIGMSRPYSSKLRFATDFRVSNTGGTGLVKTTINAGNEGTPQSPTSGSGNQYAWSAQAIGNNLFFDNDLSIANYSYSTGTTKSHSLVLSQIETFREKLRVDTSLQLSRASNNDGSNPSTNVRPSLGVNYRKSDALSFSAETGVEFSRAGDVMPYTKTFRKYFFLGYRWDFR